MSHALPREWFSTSIRNDSLRREMARFRLWNITAYLGAVALPLGALLFYIWQGVQVIRIGYEIDLLRRQHQSLQAEQSRLEVELASLENLRTIEGLARKELGMVRPAPEQVVVVRETPSGIGERESAAPEKQEQGGSRGHLMRLVGRMKGDL